MPYEEYEIYEIMNELILYSNKKISEKLSDISSVESLVELRNDFEKRIRSYFKSIFEANTNESRTFCLNLLHNLQLS
jgi:hypothetical protein